MNLTDLHSRLLKAGSPPVYRVPLKEWHELYEQLFEKQQELGQGIPYTSPDADQPNFLFMGVAIAIEYDAS